MINNQYQLNGFIQQKLFSFYQLTIKNPLAITSILIISSLFVPKLASAGAEIKEYGIAILPDAECIKVAEDLNVKIVKTLGNVQNVKNYWHINLYQAAYEEKDLPIIHSKLQQLILKPFNFSIVRATSLLDRWIELEIEKPVELQRVHEEVIEIGGPYHRRQLLRVADIYKKLPAARRKQADIYGVGGVKELYNPTITLFYQYPPLVKLKSATKEVASNLPKKQLICKADKLVLGKIGYNGNVEEIIYTINIPN